MATAKNQYSPDAIIPTEQVLKGYLEDMGLSQHDLAEKCGYSTDSINKIISGETRIEPGIANRLEQALGLKAYIWLGIEQKYQDSLAHGTQDNKSVSITAAQ